MLKVGIIGYGRFGRLLHALLKDDFEMHIFDRNNLLIPVTECDAVFLCVPIRHLRTVLNTLAELHPKATIIDTCSVKLYPVTCMQEILPKDTAIIATHPLFGPDSYYTDTNNRMMMHPVQHADEPYLFWKNYFKNKGISIIEITPDEHDRYSARSQGLTHLLGRTLQHMRISSTPIDTLGFERLLSIMNQTCNDSWDLFYDLQHFNPYTKSLIDEIEASLISLKKRD